MKKILTLIISFTAPLTAFAQIGGFGNNETPVSGPGGQFDFDGSSDQVRSNSQIGDSATPAASTELQNPLKADSFEGLFQNILTDVIIPVSATIGVIFIIWAGFGFVMAQGNDTKLSEAKKRLKWVLIGVGIVIASEVILDLLLNTIREVSTINP